MQVLIVEDELTAVRRLKRLLAECDSSITVLESLDSVSTSVAWLQSHPVPDLIFMDIQLADGLSFEIFEQVDMEVPIIFCTAYDKYAIQAFKVNSIDYLLKPIHQEDLQKSLEKYQKLHSQQTDPVQYDFQELMQQLSGAKKEYKTRFLVKVGTKLLSVPVEKIAYFYTEYKVVNLVTLDKKIFPLDCPLDEVERVVSPDMFFRVNRQTVISIQSVKNVENDAGRLYVSLTVPTQNTLTVSREKSSAFKHWLDQ